jgi:hypothetical protein
MKARQEMKKGKVSCAIFRRNLSQICEDVLISEDGHIVLISECLLALTIRRFW